MPALADRMRFGLSRRGIPPVTGAVLAANLATFLADFFAQRPLWTALYLDPARWLVRPWTLLTYALSTPAGIFGLLIMGWVYWWVGSTLEREWGSLEFGLFFLAVVLGGALAHVAAAGVLVSGDPLAGLGLPLGAVFIAWCMTHPDRTVLVMFVIPVRALYLGYISLALVYFGTGPYLGLFALMTPLAAWWYGVRGRVFRHAHRWLPRGSASAPRIRSYKRSWSSRLNPIAWYQRKKRRREFERLARISGLSDDGEKDDRERGPTIH